MKRKRMWGLLLSASMLVSLLGGCASRASVTEDMIPTVVDLGKDEEIPQEEEASVISLAMNKSYMAELTRLDGDNTMMARVDAKEIPVVLKATSMDKDLKVKIVNRKNDRVITGTKFEVTVTDVNQQSKSYTDDDKDGIIYIKEMAPGKCTVSMKSAGGYGSPKDITAEVKANLEYKVVDIVDEIKKESEINVAKEDSNTSGNDSAGTATVLKDTVEFVESTKTEIMRQKVDEYGTPMYERIISEPAKHHVDGNKDGKCDRCGAAMACVTHSYNEGTVTKEATCTAEGQLTKKCSVCGAETTEVIPKKAHTFDEWGRCTVCGALGENHTHDYEETVTKEPTCTEEGQKTKKCKICGDETTEILPKTEHTYDEQGKCTVCGAEDPNYVPPVEPEPPVDTQPTDTGVSPEPEVKPETQAEPAAAAVRVRSVRRVGAPVSEKIVYDTTSAPVMEGTGVFKYTGWQTIDGVTCYFDKNGTRVTGVQVIQGIQYDFGSEGKRSGTIGIDVSKYQTNINWKKVKNAGIDFVIIRCGYRGYGSGVLVEDPLFASHITGAKAAGLRVGVYFFSQAINEAEAVEEASMAVKLANRYGINMPIAIDSEYAAGGRGRADGLSKAERTKVTIAFCNTVASAGHTPMVYASKSWFGEHLNTSQFPGSYRIWVAHYAEKCGYSGRYDIWQNTSKGRVDGISGNVDMNISSI